MERTRNFCLTIWEEALLPKLSLDNVRGSVYQKEKCPTSGRVHWQSFVQYKNVRTLSAVRKDFPKTDVRQSVDPRAASKYCAKDDTRLEDTVVFGFFKFKGMRQDLDTFRDAVIAGTRRREAIETWPNIMASYRHFYDTIRSCHRPPDRPREVLLFYGPPGLGKTFDARAVDPDFWPYPVQKGVWFPGYDGDDTVLLDEFEGNLPLNITLRLLHEYTERVETKGGHTWWNPARIIITCNIHPALWYNNWHGRTAKYPAFARRITHVREYTALGVFEEPDPLDFLHLTPDLHEKPTLHIAYPSFGLNQ